MPLTDLQKYGKWIGSPQIGRMYHFIYDAKWKKSLPYWDKFPLSVISGPAPNGFYGINFHYLPPGARKAILSELTEHAIKLKGKGQRAIFQADYDFLQTLVYEDQIKKCFKHYLHDHVQSTFLEINPRSYPTVIMLPTAQWYNYEKRGKAPY